VRMGNELLLGEPDLESFLECDDHLDDVEPHPHLEGRGHLTSIRLHAPPPRSYPLPSRSFARCVRSHEVTSTCVEFCQSDAASAIGGRSSTLTKMRVGRRSVETVPTDSGSLAN
jgi:hypothetical protein